MEHNDYTTPKKDTPKFDTKLSGGVVPRGYEFDYASAGILFALVLIVVGLVYVLTSTGANEGVVLEQPTQETDTQVPDGGTANVFDGVEIEGTSAIVWDAKTNTMLYGKNEEEQLPLASLTKLMTVIAAHKYLDPDDTVVVQDKNLQEEGDSGLLALEEWRAKDLIDFTLMVSSNDGASVLANAAGAAKLVRSAADTNSPEDAFVEDMNALADEIGLRQTYFINETGLDPTTVTSGGYGSAKDAALLMQYILNTAPQLLDATVYDSRNITSESNFVHTATNTNQNVGDIPGLIASKTGFTDLAGGNLVVAFDAGIEHPVIIAVLGSTIEGRFSDVKKLTLAALKDIEQ